MIQLPDDGSGTTPPPQPPATPPSPAPSEGPADRRSNMMIAWVAVIGVVIGGVIASCSSYYTATYQAQTQQRQAVDDYRRDQRKDIYVQILSDVTALEKVEAQLNVPLLLSVEPGSEIEKPDLLGWEQAFDALDRSIAEATIVSSQDVINASVAIRQIHRDVYDDLVSISTTIQEAAEEFSQDVYNTQPGFGEKSEELQSRIEGLLGNISKTGSSSTSDKVQQYRNDFIAAAKDDLDLND